LGLKGLNPSKTNFLSQQFNNGKTIPILKFQLKTLEA
jgi:hypothetical protein